MIELKLDHDLYAQRRQAFVQLVARLPDPYQGPLQLQSATAAFRQLMSNNSFFLSFVLAKNLFLEPTLIKGVPIDDPLPPSPLDGKRVLAKGNVSEWSLRCIANIIGAYPVAYHNEKDGDLIHQVCPQPGKETEKSNAGSDDFAFHIEAPHHYAPPDFIVLLCLRGNEKAFTTFAEWRKMLETAPRSVLEAIQRPEFRCRLSPSFGATSAPTVALCEPDVRSGRMLYRIDLEEMDGLTHKARFALDWLRDRLQEPGVVESYNLTPGDCIILNNRAVVHGRTAFPTVFDGNHRWLQRSYLTYDQSRGNPALADDRYPYVWDGNP